MFFFQLKNQSVEVGDPVKGESRVRRNARHPVIESIYNPEIKTVFDIYLYGGIAISIIS